MNIAIIPARGGSKRIPGKNIKLFHGKPIIAYSIAAAQASFLFDRIVVSSEDEKIGQIAQECGAEWIERDPALAEVGGAPDPGTQEVTRHVLLGLSNLEDFLYACCIYPCAPMLTARDLQYTYALACLNQSLPFVYIQGWYYLGWVERFVDSVPETEGVRLPGPPGRWIDIDTEEDWREAELMYAKLYGREEPSV